MVILRAAMFGLGLSVDGQASAIIGVADPIKEGPKEPVAAMQKSRLNRRDDGINAPPVCAKASGAMEAAGVTLMRSVPLAIDLSKTTMRNIKENLEWALVTTQF